MFNCTVSSPTLSPKSNMATPGGSRSSRSRRTLSTRLPMVSMSSASESLVEPGLINVELEEDCPY